MDVLPSGDELLLSEDERRFKLLLSEDSSEDERSFMGRSLRASTHPHPLILGASYYGLRTQTRIFRGKGPLQRGPPLTLSSSNSDQNIQR